MSEEDLLPEVYSEAFNEASELLKDESFYARSTSGQAKLQSLYEKSTDVEQAEYWPMLMEGFFLKDSIRDLK